MMAHRSGSSLPVWPGFLLSVFLSATAGIRARLGDSGNAQERKIWMSFLASVMWFLE